MLYFQFSTDIRFYSVVVIILGVWDEEGGDPARPGQGVREGDAGGRGVTAVVATNLNKGF